MEVRLFPNSMRPGTGLKPRREAQRPLLPQHARHCPVLEAGSALGFLVYPPLERIESFYVGYQGDGKYQLTYFLNASQSQGAAIFSVALHLPMGSIGIVREQITFMSKDHPVSPETAMALTRTFIVPEDLGTPAVLRPLAIRPAAVWPAHRRSHLLDVDEERLELGRT